jgi:hypothetical protein
MFTFHAQINENNIYFTPYSVKKVQISTNYEKILQKFAVLSFARNGHNSFKTMYKTYNFRVKSGMCKTVNGDISIENLQGGTFAFEHLYWQRPETRIPYEFLLG